MKKQSLEVHNISVSFPGVKALQGVSIEFRAGKIHAVLGANGSGKSTLVKVLTGIYHPDKGTEGKIRVSGKEIKDIDNPNMANQLGIRVVHQESPLLDTFTIEECIALFKGYPLKGVRINWKKIKEYALELFRTYDIKVNPEALVDDLRAADRNMIAMAMAMGIGDELEKTEALLLDEADASIPESEAESFLNHVRKIADMGIPVIMVTHRLKEVMQYCDELTILNGGQIVYSGQVKETPEELIVSRMMKRDESADGIQAGHDSRYTLKDLWDKLKKSPPVKDGKPILEMKDIYAKGLNGVSFEVMAGEILGIIGIPDSGVKELPNVLGGDAPVIKGTYSVAGEVISGKMSPRKMYKAGVTVLPTDRPVKGGIMSCSLRDNVLMPNERQFWNKRKLAKETMRMCTEIFDIQPGNSINMEFGKFSGGNQQKAIMAKWLSVCPRVFVLDDPTYGVDPASRIRIFDAMEKAAQMNVGIIVFSTEPEQLAGLCTRIIVLREGRVKCELNKRDLSLTRDSIARWCYI